MAANLKPIAATLEEEEFQLSAVMHVAGQGETHLVGFVKSFAAALQRARTLAGGGWRVTIDPADPHDVVTARVIVEPVCS